MDKLFPDLLMWIRIGLIGAAVITAIVLGFLLVKVWGPRVTQATDTLANSIWETLGSGLNWILPALGLVVILFVWFGPKAVSKSIDVINNLRPTATPTPLPRWDVYLPATRR